MEPPYFNNRLPTGRPEREEGVVWNQITRQHYAINQLPPQFEKKHTEGKAISHLYPRVLSCQSFVFLSAHFNISKNEEMSCLSCA